MVEWVVESVALVMRYTFNSVPSFLLPVIGLYALKQLIMEGFPMLLGVTTLDLDFDVPWQTARKFWMLQAVHVGFLSLALATGQYLESRIVQGTFVIILQDWALRC